MYHSPSGQVHPGNFLKHRLDYSWSNVAFRIASLEHRVWWSLSMVCSCSKLFQKAHCTQSHFKSLWLLLMIELLVYQWFINGLSMVYWSWDSEGTTTQLHNGATSCGWCSRDWWPLVAGLEVLVRWQRQLSGLITLCYPMSHPQFSHWNQHCLKQV